MATAPPNGGPFVHRQSRLAKVINRTPSALAVRRLRARLRLVRLVPGVATAHVRHLSGGVMGMTIIEVVKFPLRNAAARFSKYEQAARRRRRTNRGT
jgi:hypothetical protein